ncbi:MAG: DUF5107 domain-containing protein [Anaerolineales bacterium]
MYLRVERWTLPVAEIGPDSSLPALTFSWTASPKVKAKNGVPVEIVEQSQYGQPHSILPYAMQDHYNRKRHPEDVKIAVLENDHILASFLLEYGGRLWSLQDQKSGRELLAINREIQPANLALRSAWFSGG